MLISCLFWRLFVHCFKWKQTLDIALRNSNSNSLYLLCSTTLSPCVCHCCSVPNAPHHYPWSEYVFVERLVLGSHKSGGYMKEHTQRFTPQDNEPAENDRIIRLRLGASELFTGARRSSIVRLGVLL